MMREVRSLDTAGPVLVKPARLEGPARPARLELRDAPIGGTERYRHA